MIPDAVDFGGNISCPIKDIQQQYVAEKLLSHLWLVCIVSFLLIPPKKKEADFFLLLLFSCLRA